MMSTNTTDRPRYLGFYSDELGSSGQRGGQGGEERMSQRSLQFLPSIEPLELPNNLSLTPRVKLLLTIFRKDPSPTPVDEWKLKSSLLDFLKASLSLSVADEDVQVQRAEDLKKRKREDPVATGTLCIRELGFLKKGKEKKVVGVDEDDDVKVLDARFLEWRKSVVGKLDGMELNIEGAKFQLNVELPVENDFEWTKLSWEGISGFGSYNRGSYTRGASQRPDTLVLEGLPSRWFAEPRVSSKPSMLVSHTIFSALGKIRNLNVAGDDDLGKTPGDAVAGAIMPGLQCKIQIQFERHEDFSNAFKVLCGRSMQKQGSRLRADYKVTWDKDGIFRHKMQQRPERNQMQEKNYFRNEVSRFSAGLTRSGNDISRPKRFRE
ncbi:hypothetical protein H6P81_020715 [Aristolochia fimbriata]|uniref:Uncharacterized protein n=1 Tax=Aristolochia fimbriata TaxID=158543 RepID=A0AAV7DV95_ARIFI|nr:hypothetical protein H6P81_020715 [Aristolochia fimbriata]